jgi:protein tyrosine/serine phosphatase
VPLNNFGLVTWHPLADNHNTAHVGLYRSAQPDAEGFWDLNFLIGPYVSYRLSDPTEGVSLADETEVLTKIGCRVIHDPRLGAGINPDKGVVKTIVKDIQDLYLLGNNVLIHCLHGRERTGLIAAGWKLLYGDAKLADVMADLEAFGITGLTRIVDTLVVDCVQDLAANLGGAKDESTKK